MFVFRQVDDTDVAMLCEWLNRPHLQQWWAQGQVTPELVRAEHLPAPREPSDAVGFIVSRDDSPIGFIQFYDANVDPDWWPDPPGPGVLGIDQFLADEESLGRGIGSAMIGAFVRERFRDPGVTEIRVDPRPDNLRAIACYRKVGFRDVGPIGTPEGPAILMVLPRPRITLP